MVPYWDFCFLGCWEVYVSFLSLIFCAFCWKSVLDIYLQAWWEWIKSADNELSIGLPQSAYVKIQPRDRDEFTLDWGALSFGEIEFVPKI